MVSSISNVLTILKNRIGGMQVEAGAARGWSEAPQAPFKREADDRTVCTSEQWG